MRILDHPILGKLSPKGWIEIGVDGEKIEAIEGEPIAAARIASGRCVLRYTERFSETRGIFFRSSGGCSGKSIKSRRVGFAGQPPWLLDVFR